MFSTAEVLKIAREAEKKPSQHDHEDDHVNVQLKKRIRNRK